jgi:polysaccharide transporter, PST family
LFEVCDRYLIVHYSGLEPIEALRMVGNYHSSRIIPVLFVGIAGMIGAMITPHLSFDWEKGNRRAVIDRLNMVTKTTALVQFVAAVAVLLAAPLLFEVAFRNKLSGGLEVLPWTLVYCSFFSLFAIAQNYLWCAERAGLSSLSLLLGLVAGVGSGLMLVPSYGLHGAVWAATCANLVALGSMYFFSELLGMRFDRGTWLATFAPISVGLGLAPAAVVLIALLFAALATNQIFTRREKHQLRLAAAGYLMRARQLIQRRASTACADAMVR